MEVALPVSKVYSWLQVATHIDPMHIAYHVAAEWSLGDPLGLKTPNGWLLMGQGVPVSQFIYYFPLAFKTWQYHC